MAGGNILCFIKSFYLKITNEYEREIVSIIQNSQSQETENKQTSKQRNKSTSPPKQEHGEKK